ncbi:MAG: pyridoxine 5'-phosphate synthase [Myxococcota bacterium]
MRNLIVSLDAIAGLAEASAGRASFDLGAAAALAELAGAGGVRIGLREDLRPIGEAEVLHLRRASRSLELRLPPSPGLLKPALEARPDRVVIAGESWESLGGATPLDLRTQAQAVQAMLRSLDDAAIPAVLVLAPSLDAVKAGHGLGARSVELYTGATVDLPRAERRAALEQLADATRLASKLRLGLSIGGALDDRSAPEVLEVAPSAERVAIGRAFAARALLVGVDRAVRDLRARVE